MTDTETLRQQIAALDIKDLQDQPAYEHGFSSGIQAALQVIDALTPSPEAEPVTRYSKPVCRGLWALGTACGHCERCTETRVTPPPAPQPAAQAEPVEGQICRICDGGPGNQGVCLCGERAYETPAPQPEAPEAQDQLDPATENMIGWLLDRDVDRARVVDDFPHRCGLDMPLNDPDDGEMMDVATLSVEDSGYAPALWKLALAVLRSRRAALSAAGRKEGV